MTAIRSIIRSAIDPTDTLMIDRKIVEFSRMCGASNRDRMYLLRQLADLQRSIYSLDALGETTWDIQPSVLRAAWDEIRAYAQVIDSLQVQRGLDDILKYQGIELGMREGVSVSDTPINEFYTSKSCDVRMMRRIVGDRLLNVSKQDFKAILATWDIHDAITEIVDDLLDLQEDSTSLNGNRLLCLARRVGSSTALAEYRQHLHQYSTPLHERSSIVLAELGRVAASFALEDALRLTHDVERRLEHIVHQEKPTIRAA